MTISIDDPAIDDVNGEPECRLFQDKLQEWTDAHVKKGMLTQRDINWAYATKEGEFPVVDFNKTAAIGGVVGFLAGLVAYRIRFPVRHRLYYTNALQTGIVCGGIGATLAFYKKVRDVIQYYSVIDNPQRARALSVFYHYAKEVDGVETDFRRLTKDLMSTIARVDQMAGKDGWIKNGDEDEQWIWAEPDVMKDIEPDLLPLASAYLHSIKLLRDKREELFKRRKGLLDSARDVRASFENLEQLQQGVYDSFIFGDLRVIGAKDADIQEGIDWVVSGLYGPDSALPLTLKDYGIVSQHVKSFWRDKPIEKPTYYFEQLMSAAVVGAIGIYGRWRQPLPMPWARVLISSLPISALLFAWGTYRRQPRFGDWDPDDWGTVQEAVWTINNALPVYFGKANRPGNERHPHLRIENIYTSQIRYDDANMDLEVG